MKQRPIWRITKRLTATALAAAAAALFFSLPSAHATLIYKLTFDNMAAGDAANPYTVGTGETAPTNVVLDRIDGADSPSTVGQIVTSTGPQGGEALSLSPSASDVSAGYHSDRHQTGVAESDNVTAVTLEGLIKVSPDNLKNNLQGIVTQYGTSGISPVLRMNWSDGKPVLNFGTFSTQYSTGGLDDLLDHHWHHVAGVFSWSNAGHTQADYQIWLDGVKILDESKTFTTAPTNASRLFGVGWGFGLGAYAAEGTGRGRTFGGQIDAVAVSTDALNKNSFVLPVPEPGSLTLLGLGGVAMLSRKRRQA